MPSQVLDADGLMLRPLEPGDAAALYAAVQESIESVGKWLDWCRPEYKLAEAESWIARQAEFRTREIAYEFGIFESHGAGAALLGCGGVNSIVKQNRTGNLGYWLRTSAAGRGVATRAARRMLQFGFDEIALGRIEIVAAVDNIASVRVADKLGGLFEAVCRNRLVAQGKSVPARLYSFVPEDFLKTGLD